MKDCVIVSACRTAIGTFGGTLKDINCAILGMATLCRGVSLATFIEMC
jgi:acetyl-CoA C-acetyltransferase